VILIACHLKEGIKCIDLCLFFFSAGRSGCSYEVREAVSQQFPLSGSSHQTCLSGKGLFKAFFKNTEIMFWLRLYCLENCTDNVQSVH